MNKIVRWFCRLSTRRSLPKQKPQPRCYSEDNFSAYSRVEDFYEDIRQQKEVTTDRGDTAWSRTLQKFYKSKHPKTDSTNTRSSFWLFNAKMSLEDHLQPEMYRFKETELLKRRGYHCATNRPLICICTCDKARKKPLPSTHNNRKSTGSNLLNDRLPWDASWVFRSCDEDMEKVTDYYMDKLDLIKDL